MRAHTCTREDCTSPVVGRKLCRRHYQQAWKAGEFVNQPLPPRVAGRTICPDEHKHAGSTTCYIMHQCRCIPCKEHHAAAARRRHRLKAYGRFDTGLVDAEPVREHMMMLAEYGIGYKRAAALGGIGITAARTLIWGRQEPGPRNGEIQKRVKRETAEAILAVRPQIENLARGQTIPARGVHRRVQALVARGWSQSKIAARLSVERGNFWLMMQQPMVTVRLHLQVAALYEELWNVEPPHAEHRDKIAYSRALTYAREHRWLPPLASDDIDTDVEPPVPDDERGIDEMAVELAIAGEGVRLSHDERREAITRLHALKWADARIAERLHLAARSVWRIRQELGLEAFDQTEIKEAS